jgi:hypothetical protein
MVNGLGSGRGTGVDRPKIVGERVLREAGSDGQFKPELRADGAGPVPFGADRHWRAGGTGIAIKPAAPVLSRGSLATRRSQGRAESAE